MGGNREAPKVTKLMKVQVMGNGIRNPKLANKIMAEKMGRKQRKEEGTMGEGGKGQRTKERR